MSLEEIWGFKQMRGDAKVLLNDQLTPRSKQQERSTFKRGTSLLKSRNKAGIKLESEKHWKVHEKREKRRCVPGRN